MSATRKIGTFAFAMPNHHPHTSLTDLWSHSEVTIHDASSEFNLLATQPTYDMLPKGVSYLLSVGQTPLAARFTSPVASFDEDDEIEEDDDFEDDDFEDDDFEDDDFEDDDFEDDEFDDDAIDDEIEGDADLDVDVENLVEGAAAVQAGPKTAPPWYVSREARRMYRLN